MAERRQPPAGRRRRGDVVILLLLLSLLATAARAFFLLPPPSSSHRPSLSPQPRRGEARAFTTSSSSSSSALLSTLQEEKEQEEGLGQRTGEQRQQQRLPPRRVYESWRWRGYNINYRVEGDKGEPPLLLIHGFGASVNHFRNQFQMLPPLGYRVYAVDLLGFGASDKEKDKVEYELELWRDLLVDFMVEMEAQGERGDWTVMGNSIGGLLTLMVAQARGPESVKGCVLFNCAGGLTSFRDEELPWYLRPLWIFVRAVLFGDIFGPGLFQRFRTEENVRSVLSQVYGNATAVDDDLVDILLLPGQDDGAEEVFLKVLRAPAGPSPESILPSIQVPIIGIWGEKDPWTPMTTGMHPGSKFHLHNPRFRLYPLPETGHCPMDERPAQTLEILEPFLRDEVYGGGAAAARGGGE